MQCPGQDSRYWTGSAVFESACDKCGQTLEFFKDDSTRVCKSCGQRMLNPKLDFGCASYCPYASQCLGELPPELLKKKQEELVEQVAVAVKQLYGEDFRRIGHAGRVARQAAELAEGVAGANPAVVKIAAYLHDLYHLARENDPADGEIRRLLTGLNANPGLVDEVCGAVAFLHQPKTTGEPETTATNFRILAAAHQAAKSTEHD